MPIGREALKNPERKKRIGSFRNAVGDNLAVVFSKARDYLTSVVSSNWL